MVNAIFQQHLVTVIKPFMSNWVSSSIASDLAPEAVTKPMVITSGLGHGSVYAWLRLSCVDDTEQIVKASTLPSLILGDEIPKNADATLEEWRIALQQPNVFGLVVGRFLLLLIDNDMAKAIDDTMELL